MYTTTKIFLAVLIAGSALIVLRSGARPRDRVADVPSDEAANPLSDMRRGLNEHQAASHRVSEPFDQPHLRANPPPEEPESSSSSGLVEPPTTDSRDVLTPEDLEEEAQERIAQEIALWDRTVDFSVQDSWATQHRVELRNRLAEALTDAPNHGLTLSEVDCGGELCRVVLQGDSSTNLTEALPLVSDSLGDWSGARFYRATPGDNPEVVLFAARENLPSIDPQ